MVVRTAAWKGDKRAGRWASHWVGYSAAEKVACLVLKKAVQKAV